MATLVGREAAPDITCSVDSFLAVGAVLEFARIPIPCTESGEFWRIPPRPIAHAPLNWELLIPNTISAAANTANGRAVPFRPKPVLRTVSY